MILSIPLQALFNTFEPDKLVKMCDSLFHKVYVKTRWASDSPGLYHFYSKDKSDMFIDDHSDESPWACAGRDVICIHGYDEEYIIKALCKFDKLKAFL